LVLFYPTRVKQAYIRVGKFTLKVEISSVNGRILKIGYPTSVIGVGKTCLGLDIWNTPKGRKSYFRFFTVYGPVMTTDHAF